jgi:hypothetical protein
MTNLNDQIQNQTPLRVGLVKHEKRRTSCVIQGCGVFALEKKCLQLTPNIFFQLARQAAQASMPAGGEHCRVTAQKVGCAKGPNTITSK